MKYVTIGMILFFVFLINESYAELDRAILEPFENSDVVIIGTVIQINTVASENKTQYDLKVEEYLKSEKPFNLITATLDSIRPVDFPNDPLDYFNKPYFEKGNQVFVYLKQDDGTFQMSPYSFTIKKPTVAGPPTLIHPTGPQEHITLQGNEIVISGTIKKSYLYLLEKSELDSSFNLVVLDENEKQVEFKKLDISLDGSYSFTFQDKDEMRIPGKYSWNITYENGGMGGEFIVIEDSKRWTPLKQFKSGVTFEELTCKKGLEHTIKINDFERFYCTSHDTKQTLIKRSWAFDESKACRNPMDCFDSGVSIDRTFYQSEPESILNDSNTAGLIELSKNTPEVKAFHMQYEDAQTSVRDDHISYFSGSEDDYLVRMNLYFDENHVMEHIDFHCYYQKVHQFELSQEDLTSKIEKYDCKEYAESKNED